MSLQLSIKQIANIKIEGQTKIEQRLSFLIQNSKNGTLLTGKMKFNRLRWQQNHKFTTCVDDNVEFVLIKGVQNQAQLKENILGRGNLYTKKFLRMFQKEVQQKQSKNQSFQYEITLYKQSTHEQISIGTVQLQITLDVSKRLEGQMISGYDLDLRGEKHSNPKFVKFYLGKSNNVNLFNIFDEKVQTPTCRLFESIYKDFS